MKKLQTYAIIYSFLDYVATSLAWFCFFVFRKIKELPNENYSQLWTMIFNDYKFYLGIFVIPLCWVFLFFFTNSYNKIIYKSRINELLLTFKQILIGTIVLFFATILDDYIIHYKDYFLLYSVLFGLCFGFVAIFRMLYLTLLKRLKRKKEYKIRTILIGESYFCTQLYHKLKTEQNENNYQFIGYVSIDKNKQDYIDKKLPCLGAVDEIDKITKKMHIENIIIAIENRNQQIISTLIPLLINNKIILQVLPNKDEHLFGMVKNTNILQEALIQIDFNFNIGQRIIKRMIDIVFSALFLIIFSPIYVFLAIGVKLSSPGPIFYKQERIGKNGKPFHIIKFRSMINNAEQNGPQLSNAQDNRVTSFGRSLRKTHLDEIPQFFNVLKGDMSLVGHRPERQYYIDKIIEKNPYYQILLFEKPGVTSWGQIRYGYAENVDQMVERLYYDLRYIENFSLILDIKILIYTILYILKSEEKQIL